MLRLLPSLYAQYQDFVSKNWPHFWRARPEIPILFVTISAVLFIILFIFAITIHVVGIDSPKELPVAMKTLGVILGAMYGIAWIVSAFFWLSFAIRPLPIRYHKEYVSSPSFMVVFVCVLLLASPILSALINEGIHSEPGWLKQSMIVFLLSILLISVFVNSIANIGLASTLIGMIYLVTLLSVATLFAMLLRGIYTILPISHGIDKDTLLSILLCVFSILVTLYPFYIALSAFSKQTQTLEYSNVKGALPWGGIIIGCLICIGVAEFEPLSGDAEYNLLFAMIVLNIVTIMVVEKITCGLSMLPHE
jgi:hypothetical protein